MSKDKVHKQTADKTSKGSGAQEKWEANMNTLHISPMPKTFVTGVGKRPKSTKND